MPVGNWAKVDVIHSQRGISLGLSHFYGLFRHSREMIVTSLETKREEFDVRRSDCLCAQQGRRIRIKQENF